MPCSSSKSTCCLSLAWLHHRAQPAHGQLQCPRIKSKVKEILCPFILRLVQATAGSRGLSCRQLLASPQQELQSEDGNPNSSSSS